MRRAYGPAPRGRFLAWSVAVVAVVVAVGWVEFFTRPNKRPAIVLVKSVGWRRRPPLPPRRGNRARRLRSRSAPCTFAHSLYSCCWRSRPAGGSVRPQGPEGRQRPARAAWPRRRPRRRRRRGHRHPPGQRRMHEPLHRGLRGQREESSAPTPSIRAAPSATRPTAGRRSGRSGKGSPAEWCWPASRAERPVMAGLVPAIHVLPHGVCCYTTPPRPYSMRRLKPVVSVRRSSVMAR